MNSPSFQDLLCRHFRVPGIADLETQRYRFSLTGTGAKLWERDRLLWVFARRLREMCEASGTDPDFRLSIANFVCRLVDLPTETEFVSFSCVALGAHYGGWATDDEVLWAWPSDPSVPRSAGSERAHGEA